MTISPVAPVSTVAQLQKVFNVTTKRQKYFRALARNEKFFEESSANLFTVLDKNKDGALQLKEISPVLEVLFTKCAEVKVGFTWGLGPAIRSAYQKSYHDDLMPTSLSKKGLEIFDLKVLMRGCVLYCADVPQKEVDAIKAHFFKTRQIDYKCMSSSKLRDVPAIAGDASPNASPAPAGSTSDSETPASDARAKLTILTEECSESPDTKPEGWFNYWLTEESESPLSISPQFEFDVAPHPSFKEPWVPNWRPSITIEEDEETEDSSPSEDNGPEKGYLCHCASCFW